MDYRRTSPSGGSLQASEAYWVALQIKGLPNGIYHDDPIHHLRLINKPIEGQLLGGLLGGQMCQRVGDGNICHLTFR